MKYGSRARSHRGWDVLAGRYIALEGLNQSKDMDRETEFAIAQC